MSGYKALVNRPVQRFAVRVSRFLQKRPLLAKAVPTAVGFAFGDVLTQYMNNRRRKRWYNPKLTAMMAGLGLCLAGPAGLAFMRWMDFTILPGHPHSPVTIAVKFVLDQVWGCVLWQASYLSISKPYRQAAFEYCSSLAEQVNGHTDVLLRRRTTLA